ncbi:dolichol-phosphate mannosyltransferase subunit 3 [Rhodocollybia butyracea]|uniref:Dolichol-phosphate mannosyltransferase subunit 3 n=1 Tax=Rhodocollybia butyracea TaxID=206335 RepID=A0A9P5U6R5_9AGAR|nr:dolichol-phosphate mannosyltransferase subunit 3 [Rhodocollybia butyracea]
MTRAQRVAVISLVLTTLYFLVFFETLQVPLVDDAVVQQILPVLPWWLLVSFGSYSLWSLGWGLFTFRDCPEAYEELLTEISQAKNELRNRGVTVD